MVVYRLVVIALSLAGAWYLCTVALPMEEKDIRDAIGVLVGASATLLGFLVSSGALLYAVANTRLVKNLQRTGHFQKLLADLFIDATAFLVALIIGLVCLFLPATLLGENLTSNLHAGLYALIFANTASYLLLLPVGYKMWVLLLNLEPDDDDEHGKPRPSGSPGPLDV